MAALWAFFFFFVCRPLGWYLFKKSNKSWEVWSRQEYVGEGKKLLLKYTSKLSAFIWCVFTCCWSLCCEGRGRTAFKWLAGWLFGIIIMEMGGIVVLNTIDSPINRDWNRKLHSWFIKSLKAEVGSLSLWLFIFFFSCFFPLSLGMFFFFKLFSAWAE